MAWRSYVDLRIVRDDGAELNMSDRPDAGWFLPSGSLDGFAELDLTVDSYKNVLTDGSSLVAKRAEAKDRTVDGARWIGPDADAARARAVSFFNPRHSFEAHLAYRGRTRWCIGELSGFRCEANNLNAPPELTFTLLCLDPWMRGEDDHSEAFTDARAGFGFPFVSHAREPRNDGSRVPPGFPVSTLYYDGAGRVYNGGDVPCRYRIRCEFVAPAKNPVFTHDGRFVKVADAFEAGDVLEVDFEAAPPRVTKNGADCIHLCTRDSSFVGMEMAVGENRFGYSCDGEGNLGAMRVAVLHTERFTGV